MRLIYPALFVLTEILIWEVWVRSNDLPATAAIKLAKVTAIVTVLSLAYALFSAAFSASPFISIAMACIFGAINGVATFTVLVWQSSSSVKRRRQASR